MDQQMQQTSVRDGGQRRGEELRDSYFKDPALEYVQHFHCWSVLNGSINVL